MVRCKGKRFHEKICCKKSVKNILVWDFVKFLSILRAFAVFLLFLSKKWNISLTNSCIIYNPENDYLIKIIRNGDIYV